MKAGVVLPLLPPPRPLYKWIGKKSPREFIKNLFLRLMNAKKKKNQLWYHAKT
jgi:hypothetical protein